MLRLGRRRMRNAKGEGEMAEESLRGEKMSTFAFLQLGRRCVFDGNPHRSGAIKHIPSCVNLPHAHAVPGCCRICFTKHADAFLRSQGVLHTSHRWRSQLVCCSNERNEASLICGILRSPRRPLFGVSDHSRLGARFASCVLEHLTQRRVGRRTRF